MSDSTSSPGSSTRRASSAPRTGLLTSGWKVAEAPGSQHSPVSAERAVLSAWWTPAWNLTFSRTRQTCPGWRCGCACGSPRCPHDQSSLAPSRPRPSTSCPCLARVAERGGGPLPWQCWLQRCSALYCASFAWSALAGALRSGTAASRLRLRQRLAQLGLGLRAPPAPQPASLCTPNCSPPSATAFPWRGMHSPRLGLWTRSGSFLQSLHPAQSQGPWDLGVEA